MTNNINTLIIPDVHGRTFWEDAINKYNKEDYPDIDIVFLGDYVDPYPFEKISPETAYNQFIKIIELAKKDNRIHLLLGNHDWHYLYNTDYCRIDKARERIIEKIIKDNISLFKFAYEKKINNKKYLFTHAGIVYGWLLTLKQNAQYEIEHWKTDRPLVGDERYEYLLDIVDFNDQYNSYEKLLNNMCNINDEFISAPIGQISKERGGWYYYGSPIWADIYEHIYSSNSLNNIYQIFGHTLSYPDLDNGFIGENFAMLDSRCAWILDNENNLYEI